MGFLNVLVPVFASLIESICQKTILAKVILYVGKTIQECVTEKFVYSFGARCTRTSAQGMYTGGQN